MEIPKANVKARKSPYPVFTPITYTCTRPPKKEISHKGFRILRYKADGLFKSDRETIGVQAEVGVDKDFGLKRNFGPEANKEARWKKSEKNAMKLRRKQEKLQKVRFERYGKFRKIPLSSKPREWNQNVVVEHGVKVPGYDYDEGKRGKRTAGNGIGDGLSLEQQVTQRSVGLMGKRRFKRNIDLEKGGIWGKRFKNVKEIGGVYEDRWGHLDGISFERKETEEESVLIRREKKIRKALKKKEGKKFLEKTEPMRIERKKQTKDQFKPAEKKSKTTDYLKEMREKRKKVKIKEKIAQKKIPMKEEKVIKKNTEKPGRSKNQKKPVKGKKERSTFKQAKKKPKEKPTPKKTKKRDKSKEKSKQKKEKKENPKPMPKKKPKKSKKSEKAEPDFGFGDLFLEPLNDPEPILAPIKDQPLQQGPQEIPSFDVGDLFMGPFDQPHTNQKAKKPKQKEGKIRPIKIKNEKKRSGSSKEGKKRVRIKDPKTEKISPQPEINEAEEFAMILADL